MIRITQGGLDDARVVSLLQKHEAINRDVSPPESCHVFTLDRLKGDDVIFLSAWDGEALLGVGALKYLDTEHGEVKSMHTSEAARRRGVAGALLDAISAAARATGRNRLSLETGSQPYFEPARALYARHGFVECPPFGDYRPDPLSIFMTREI